MNLFRFKYSLHRVIGLISSNSSSFNFFYFIITVVDYSFQMFETPSNFSVTIIVSISILNIYEEPT